MQVIKVDQNSPEWFEYRKGKITGSKLKSLIVKRGNERKIGFYELIADSLGIEDEDGLTSTRERGKLLEIEAMATLRKMDYDFVPVGMWVSDDNPNIAVSPDGANDDNTVAVEIKCLSAPNHLKAVIENKVPKEYEDQVLQYFVVNEKLEKLLVVFYDPRIASVPLHIIEVLREDIQEDVNNLLTQEQMILNEVQLYVEKLAF